MHQYFIHSYLCTIAIFQMASTREFSVASTLNYAQGLLRSSPNLLTTNLLFHLESNPKLELGDLRNEPEVLVPRRIIFSKSGHNYHNDKCESKPKFASFQVMSVVFIAKNLSSLPSSWFTNSNRDYNYYLLQSFDTPSSDLLTKPAIFQLKFRITIDIGPGIQSVDSYRLTSMCFYCNGGYSQEVRIPFTKELTEAFQDYTKDLNGTFLRVTSSKGNYRSMNYRELPNGAVGFAGGYSHEIFFCLRRKFNFNYKFFLSKGFGLKLPNGTFTGVIGNLQSGKADYAMETGFNADRFVAVEYMPPAVFESLTFLTKIPEQQTKYFIVFEPFTVETWGALLLTGILLAFIYSCLISMSQMMDRNHELAFWKNFQGGLGFYIRPFLDQGIVTMSWNHFTKLRLIATAWLVAVIILGTGYRAKLTTLMAYPLLEVLPNNFNELAASDFIIYLHDIGGVPQAIFQSNPTLRSVLARMRKEKSLLKCIGATVTEHAACVTLGDNGIFEGVKNFSNVDGKLMVHKAPTNLYPFLPGAPVLRKGQAFGTNFAKAIRRIFDMGIVYKFQADEARFEARNGKTWARSRASTEPWRQPEPRGPQPIVIEEIVAVLILYLFVVTLASAGFLFELGVTLYRRRCEYLGTYDGEVTREISDWERLQQKGYVSAIPATSQSTHGKLRERLASYLRIF